MINSPLPKTSLSKPFSSLCKFVCAILSLTLKFSLSVNISSNRLLSVCMFFPKISFKFPVLNFKYLVTFSLPPTSK